MDLKTPESRLTERSYSSPDPVSDKRICQLRNFLLSNSCSLSSIPLSAPEIASNEVVSPVVLSPYFAGADETGKEADTQRQIRRFRRQTLHR